MVLILIRIHQLGIGNQTINQIPRKGGVIFCLGFTFLFFVVGAFYVIILPKEFFIMNKCLSLILAVLVGLVGADATAATTRSVRSASSADLAASTRKNVTYSKTQRTAAKTSAKPAAQKTSVNKYTTDYSTNKYTMPANRSAMYKSQTTTKSYTKRSSTVATKKVRKYFLAHPFYQPLQGKFGTFTDLSYANASYDFPITADTTLAPDVNGVTGSWKTEQFTIKEDLSFGLTDKIALIVTAQYDVSDYKFTWDNGAPDDKQSENKLNLIGFGLQGRIVDTDNWIAMIAGYWQRQKDISNNFIAEFKAGYKVATSTIYGVGRAWLLALDGNSYGNGMDVSDDMAFYIPYQVGDENLFYAEGGLGVFSVLSQDWTLNLEATYGHYDWHNQLAAKGAIGWQPNEWFALNIYLKTVFHDNANNKVLDFYMKDVASGLNDLTLVGTADIEKYSETRAGLQVMFEF